MATAKPIAIVSPMKKVKKTRKKTNKISPRKSARSDVKNYVSPRESDDFMSGKSSDVLSLDKKANRLCSMFENLNIVPDPYDCIYPRLHIPEHDRKILERMAAKMKRDISNTEISHRAHILWENEREEREKLQREQEAEYNKFIQTKRQTEKELNDRKFQEIREILDWQKEHLRNRIAVKDNCAAKRIKALESQKHQELRWKHVVAEEKSKNALEAIKEHKLAELLWRRSLAENLEQRARMANTNREILLRYCRQRSILDNKIHQEVQRRNWEDRKVLEMEHLTKLKRRLQEKNLKIQRIQYEKEKFVRESRKLADSTARLREDLKRSLSPNMFLKAAAQSAQSYRMTPQSCFTPNSFQSHIRLG